MTQYSINHAMACVARGDLEEAKSLFLGIMVNQPHNSQALYGLGLIASNQDKPDVAIDLFKKAARSDPNHIDALVALGATLIQAGYPAKASTILAEAVKRAPQVLEPRLHLARAFNATEHYKESLYVLTDTAEQFPNKPQVWRLKGRTERSLKAFKDAFASFTHAVHLTPDDASAQNDLGVACRSIGNLRGAEEHYRIAIRLNPSLAVAYANLANVLDQSGDLDGAESAIRRALDLDANTTDATYNLACLLAKQERHERALPLFEALATDMPGRWDIQTNLGVTYLSLGDLNKAEIALRRSLALKPSNPEAHYNLAWLLLLTERNTEGWKELEWRWQLPEFALQKRSYPTPPWDGSPLEEGVLYLHAEQGLGDTIQFVRFIENVKERCNHIVLGCQTPLIPLLKDFPGLDDVVPLEEAPPPSVAHLPLLSLPHRLGFDGRQTPMANGYLNAPETIEDRICVPQTGQKRIGIVWAGSPDNKIERRRKIEPSLFLPLFDATDADFIALQIGPAAAEVSHFPKERITFSCDKVVQNFADTAAIISQLDLVIGVDTSVIHLSGALGQKTWTIIPFMPDYRWGLSQDHTHWYDSMRLFRQTTRGNWTGVITDISNALRSW